MKKRRQKPTSQQDGKSNRGHFRWAVRIGRRPGVYRSYLGHGQAEEQVSGMAACHMGFTRAQVDANCHHAYMNGHYGSDQIKKLKLGHVLPRPRQASPTQAYYDVDCTGPPLPPAAEEKTRPRTPSP